ncbi:hypothetical protein FA15DRAFT_340674 [Coprinopsis marcescibilis]|uniref:Uncharacterized protein n=1 Tax=Coprinopsis marcescibilis TaxID=230819 RepID=A0A5C3L0M6_COPMA|nr:hypothetical protein FA15DRAFT_340674 [Coprinopsis marcescibilis]
MDRNGDRPSYAATDLIKGLLTHIEHEVTDKYKRNKKAAQAIVTQSRTVSDAIVTLIQKVDAQGTAIDWEPFYNYTTGVTKLEAFLLEFLLNGHDLPETPTPDEIPQCIKFVDTWKEHRTDVTKVTQDLEACVRDAKLLDDNQRQNLTTAVVKAQREDDVETLTSINIAIQDSAVNDKDILDETSASEELVTKVKGVVLEVHTKAKNLDASIYPSSAMGMVVSGVMLVYVPFLIHGFESNSATTHEHIKSAKLWKAANEFLTQLKAAVDSNAPSEQELDKHYKAFEDILRGAVMGLIDPQIISLMKRVAKVRRPFFSRASSLVRIWYHINKDGKLQDETDVAARTKLRNAIIASAKAIDNGKTIVWANGDISENIEALNQQYDKVFNDVKSVAEKYISGQWSDLSKEYEDAEATDNKHYDDYCAKVAAAQSDDEE